MDLWITQDESEHKVSAVEEPARIMETHPLFFKLVLNELIYDPYLLVGSSEIKLSLEDSDGEKFTYASNQGKYFINNVGVAFIDIEYTGCEHARRIGYVNILSSKITTDRLYQMLQYICKVDTKLLHCCFSKTLIAAGGSNFEHIDLQHKLIKTESILQFIWDNKEKFRTQPCKRIHTKEVIRNYSPKDAIDDRSYEWLFSNIDQLHSSPSPDRTIIKFFTKEFSTEKILSAEVHEDTDVFENQVILAFVIAVKKFISELKISASDSEKISRSKKYVKNYEGFTDIAPYIQNFVFEKISKRKNLINRIEALCDSCLKFLYKFIPCSYRNNSRPRVTQYVVKRAHYLQLFKLIDGWWNIKASDFSEDNELEHLLYSVQSLDKVYELYVLLSLLESAADLGYSLDATSYLDFLSKPSMNVNSEAERPGNEAFNYYKLNQGDLQVEIYYEPIIYPLYDDMHDRELYILDKIPNESSAEKLTNSKTIRTPDYIIKVKDKIRMTEQVYVLDAKFSSYETVLYQRLPSKSNQQYGRASVGLVDKYLHGMRVNNVNSRSDLIDGIFATYISGFPQNIQNRKIQGVNYYYSLFGNKPTPPFIDLIKISPNQEDQKSNDCKKFLSKLLECSTF